ncbi:MAG: hypothetical protein ACRDRT_03730, partial [Pseudonocardiaceae bacterium]
MTTAPVAPRRPKSVLLNNPYCEPLRQMYDALIQSGATSWNQAEAGFLDAMSRFDGGLPAAFEGTDATKIQQSRELSGALQNGKGDWFNNVLAYLL